MARKLVLLTTHGLALIVGFAAGIYVLPILTAPDAPTASQVQAAAQGAKYSTAFRRDLKGSDGLHWGEGRVSISAQAVAFSGALAPGPAYKLYFVPEFVETKADFLRVKDKSLAVGDIKTFENFVVTLPADARVDDYRAVVVWCESFSQFITAAKYR
jgi:hypothetical protein